MCACCMFFEIRVKRGLIVNIIPLYIVPIYIYLYIFTCVFCTCILHMIDKWFLSQSVGFKLGQCFLSDGKSLVASNQRWINYDQKHKGGATCTPYLKHKPAPVIPSPLPPSIGPPDIHCNCSNTRELGRSL